jgi:hypothetical protein
MAEDKKKKEAITQAELTKGWRPRKHMQEGYRPQAQTQGASGSEKPKPPSVGLLLCKPAAGRTPSGCTSRVNSAPAVRAVPVGPGGGWA